MSSLTQPVGTRRSQNSRGSPGAFASSRRGPAARSSAANPVRLLLIELMSPSNNPALKWELHSENTVLMCHEKLDRYLVNSRPLFAIMTACRKGG
jgi:hypothetical protein